VFPVIILLWYRAVAMRRAPFFCIPILLAAFFFLSPSLAAAQQVVTVEQFAKTIQEGIKQRKLRVVVLVDLANAEGLITERTQGVTAEITDSLAVFSGKTKILWARYEGIAGQETLSAEDPKSIRDVDDLCAEKKCDALLLGRVQEGPAGKSVSLKIVNSQTKGVLRELSAFLPLSTGEPPSWTDPNVSDAPPYAKPGENGTSMPLCRSCPGPEYSKEARSLKIQGISVLSVVISREGVPVKIVVVKRLGYGLDRKAIEAVRKWKFETGRDRDGNPVRVIIPVEITFRLF
jgi:TonB family protein